MSEMTHMLRRALKRPSDYHALSAREQWMIDKQLGILDWEPTRDEIEFTETMEEFRVRARMLADKLLITKAIVKPPLQDVAMRLLSDVHFGEGFSFPFDREIWRNGKWK